MKISLDNFRGVDSADEHVAPRTLFTGPNGAGKTSRLWAVPWVLHGYTPHGKGPAKLADLVGRARGSMSATLELEDGFTVTRALERKGAGFSQTLVVDGQACNQADGEHMIGTRCGVFTMSLNLDEFTGLSPEERRKSILRLCGRSGADGTDLLLARLGAATLDNLIEPVGSVGAAVIAELDTAIDGLTLEDCASPSIERYWKIAGDGAREAWEHFRGELHGMAVGDMGTDLSAWLEHAKRARLDADRDVKRLQATLQQVTADKAAQGRAGSRPVEVIKAEIGKLQAERSQLQTELGALQQKVREAANQERRAASLAGEIGAAHEQVETSKAKLAALGDLDNLPDVGALRNELGGADQAWRESIAALNRAKDRLADLQRQLDGERRELESVQADDWGKALRLAEAVEVLAFETLPSFEASSLSAQLGELVEHIRSKAPAAGRLATLELSVGMLAEDFEAAKTDCSDAETRVAECEAEAKAARERLDAATMAHQKLEIAKLHRAQIANGEGRIKHLADQLEATRDEGSVAAPGNIQVLTDKIAGLDTKIGELDLARQARTRADTIDGELANCRKQVAQKEALQRVAAAVEAGAKMLRESIMDQQVRPLLSKMNEVLDAFGLAAYCELTGPRGKAVFDLGWESVTGQRTSMDQMSDGEAAVFAAPLAYALVALSGAPLKILTLECDTIQDDRLYTLLNAFHDIDDVDYVLAARFREADAGQLAGWSVVRLGEAVGV